MCETNLSRFQKSFTLIHCIVQEGNISRNIREINGRVLCWYWSWRPAEDIRHNAVDQNWQYSKSTDYKKYANTNTWTFFRRTTRGICRARCHNSITTLTTFWKLVHSSAQHYFLEFIQSFRDRVIDGLHFGRFFLKKMSSLHRVITVKKASGSIPYIFANTRTLYAS
jgi:hypothetical protein